MFHKMFSQNGKSSDKLDSKVEAYNLLFRIMYKNYAQTTLFCT